MSIILPRQFLHRTPQTAHPGLRLVVSFEGELYSALTVSAYPQNSKQQPFGVRELYSRFCNLDPSTRLQAGPRTQLMLPQDSNVASLRPTPRPPTSDTRSPPKSP